MKKSLAQSPERFQDPLGAYVQARSAAHEQRMKRYPAVEESYGGLYASFVAQGRDGRGFLGGVEGIIGTKLLLESLDEGLGFATRDGRRLGLLDEELAARLAELLREGWVVHAILAYTVYCAQDKSFTGHFACIHYSPRLDGKVTGALETFIGNIAERIASGTHPELGLSQEQFIKVIESGGNWFLTKELPVPKLPEGSVFYRRRRSLNDRLISAALEGNKGCLVLSWIGAALIVLAALTAIWWFFF
jgi:hypothetical protein